MARQTKDREWDWSDYALLLASLECEAVASYPGGDHTIFLGRVEAGETLNASKPLLYFRGKYERL